MRKQAICGIQIRQRGERFHRACRLVAMREKKAMDETLTPEE
jgi:hypothetical protein